jgi:hypothetical protein
MAPSAETAPLESRSTRVPLLPLRDNFVLPGGTYPLVIGRPPSLAALERASSGDGLLVLAQQRDPRQAEVEGAAQLLTEAVLATIAGLSDLPDGTVRAVVSVLAPCVVESVDAAGAFLTATVAQRPVAPVDAAFVRDARQRLRARVARLDAQGRYPLEGLSRIDAVDGDAWLAQAFELLEGVIAIVDDRSWSRARLRALHALYPRLLVAAGAQAQLELLADAPLGEPDAGPTRNSPSLTAMEELVRLSAPWEGEPPHVFDCHDLPTRSGRICLHDPLGLAHRAGASDLWYQVPEALRADADRHRLVALEVGDDFETLSLTVAPPLAGAPPPGPTPRLAQTLLVERGYLIVGDERTIALGRSHDELEVAYASARRLELPNGAYRVEVTTPEGAGRLSCVLRRLRA